jgi:hypothetical protein
MQTTPLALLLSSLGFTASLAAQSVAVVAATPVVATAVAGTSVLTSSLPIGPVTNGLLVVAPVASATFSPAIVVDDTRMVCSLVFGCTVLAANGLATLDPGELLVYVSMPTSALISLRATHIVSGPAGAPLPQLAVDFGDDGSVEFDEATPATSFSTSVVVGPTPLPIRIRYAAALAQVGNLTASLSITGVSATTEVLQGISGCDLVGFFAEARLDGNLQYATAFAPADPIVAVFGLELAPVLLGGTVYGPCLLMPRSDFAVYVPPGSAQVLTIPAAVRPLGFWLQPVAVTGNGLRTGDTTRILAF